MNAAPQSMDNEREALRQRLLWLTGLRWYGASGMLAVALAGLFFLPSFTDGALFLLAVFMGCYNYVYLLTIDTWDTESSALQQIVLDVLVLTLALFVTGGFLNPFFTFYFFIVIIAWIILSYWQSVFITGLVTVCFGFQGLSPMGVDLKVLGDLPFHVVGAPISFVATTVLTAYFVYIIMHDLRKREREVLTARQQAELELNKLDNILRQLGAGMLVLNMRENVRWGNDRIVEWFGPEGLDADRACYRILRVAQEMMQETGGEKKRSFYREMQLPTRRDGMRDFEIIATPVSDSLGAFSQIIELALDVTEQKKNQESWSQAQRLAAVGQLAAGVAHEINTPLGTISILANEVLEIMGDDPLPVEDIRESVATIAEQTQRCKGITQTLLNVSRKPNVAREFCSINEMIETSLELTRHRLSSIEVKLAFDAELPCIQTDRSGLERAVFNLLLNAVDAFPEGHDSPRIVIRTAYQNGVIAIEIEDNGMGIPEENLSRIYEPFFTTKDVGKGTGLGLYVTYGIVKDLGGALTIQSKPNEGTSARIELPVKHD